MTDKDYKRILWCNNGAHLFSTCSRRQYMAIIYDEIGRVSGMGYNGSPPGYAHCNDGNCPRANSDVAHNFNNYDNCIAIHAEANAIMYSDPLRRHTLYVNGVPCYSCAKLIIGAGIKRVVYKIDHDADNQGVLFLMSLIEVKGMIL